MIMDAVGVKSGQLVKAGPKTLDRDMKYTCNLREAVRNAYSAVAESPTQGHAFPVGRAFAESVGYPAELLESVPASAVDAFAGVSNVAVFAELPEAATVVDLGCGAGLDALIAARRVGPKGRVIGLDFSESMLARARQAADISGYRNVEFRMSDAESVPLEDASMDAALVNGVFNLNPARDKIFRELARVMRRGGRAWAAELILTEPMAETVQVSPDISS